MELLAVILLFYASQYLLAMGEEVFEGAELAVLPCHYSGVIPEVNPSVIWSRHDLKPQTVHLRRKEDDFCGQNQRFSGRTSMKFDALASADFSLSLRNPRLYDSGNYICSISDGIAEITVTEVKLQVKASPESLTMTMKVLKGEESVLLPCQYGKELEEVVTVKWSRSDLNPNIVHKLGNYPSEQNQLYEGRTSMSPYALTSSDFSLTLKEPQLSDSGIYICSIIDDKEEIFLSDVQLHVRASEEFLTVTVEVYKGEESVVLPCQYSKVIEDLVTVKWGRSGLNPDTVHQRRERDDLRGQNQLFEGRTSMRPDALVSGNFSLTLKEPQLSDSGIYICSIIDEEEETRLLDIQLHVKEIFPTWAVVLLVLLVLLAVSGGLLFHFRHDLISVYKVEVDSGVESVLLPFKTTVRLSEYNTTVTWRNNRNRVVHSNCYKDYQQHKQFKGRTEMNINYKSRDFSLTLKNPTDRDSGTYSCTVYDYWSGKILAEKQVLLKVKVYKVEVNSGVKSVLLPFKTTVSLTEDNTTVTWRNNDGRMVASNRYKDDQQHRQYKNRTEMKKNYGSGDFSLTLKNPTVRDSGTYSCTVYDDKSGKIRPNKQVLLKVKVYKVEVDSGVESVLLPFKTPVSLTEEVTVTWRNNSGRVVDGYDWWYKNLQQHKQYEGRTEMKINVKSRDFSLTLKNPTVRDSGTYTCTVSYRQTGEILAMKQVLLKVKADSLIMAIDFGSGFSGYAFNLKPREEGGETQLKRWGKELGLDSPKTPTCLLFDEDRQFLEFGYEAKTAYSNMRREEAEKHYFFEDFKRNILDMYDWWWTITAANNKEMTRLEVFTEVLRFLKDDALKTIKHHPAGGEISASDFTWVLTVPDSLKDLTKRILTEAAVLAGLVGEDTKDKLVFALESAAALAWCLKPPPDGFITQNHSRTSQDQPPEPAAAGTSCNDPAGGPEPGATKVLLETQNQDQVAVHFKKEPGGTKVLLETQNQDQVAEPGETRVLLETQNQDQVHCKMGTKILLETRNPDRKRYLVVDCGDQIYRITVHEVLEGGALKMLDKDFRRYLGEKKIKEFLREIFSHGVWREYEENFPSEVLKIMFEFIHLQHLDEDVQISCPDTLRERAQREKDIETFFASVEGASWEDGVIKISRDKLRSFFDDSLQRITERLRDVLNKNSNIGFIVLVGGLAESQMLRQFITDQFGHQYKVLCPLRPQEAVLKGAVELGRNPELVQFD
ncbi:uncharacterized protein V3H82_015102 isoform 18-T18 [Fundulus diaphanus]